MSGVHREAGGPFDTKAEYAARVLAMSRHPNDKALVDMEVVYPNDRCSCGHHLTQHEVEDAAAATFYCRACECIDYDGPDLDGDS